QGQPLGCIEMLRKPGNDTAEAMTGSKFGQCARFIGAGQNEGFRCESAGIVERPAEKSMCPADVRPVRLVEQEVIFKVAAQGVSGRHADVDFFAQKRARNRIPSLDIDDDLSLGVTVVEARNGAVELVAHETGNNLDRDTSGDTFAYLGDLF